MSSLAWADTARAARDKILDGDLTTYQAAEMPARPPTLL